MEIGNATVVESDPSGSLLPSSTSSGSGSDFRGKGIREGEKDLNCRTEIEERCGICLLDSAGSICGQINSCKHHFCFMCIMEWAKTESRCPLCKQRFRSICRPVVPGLFPAERLVMIPERDQVYHPLGVESTAINETHLDPHCSLCHSATNEAYLVSCALCDSTFHTSCVGLGWDIPEVELYCPDCDTCRIEYSKVQADHDNSQYIDQETKEKIRMIRRGGNSFPIQDLVANILGDDTANQRSNTRSTGGGDRTLINNRARMEQGIQALRDNWGRVRSGSVNISDVLRPYRRTEGTSQNNSVATISGAGRVTRNEESRDIEKSWEMMEKARLNLAQENRQQISRSLTIVGNSRPTGHIHPPPMKKPRINGEGVIAHHSNRAPAGSSYQPARQTTTMHREPLGASSGVPHRGFGQFRSNDCAPTGSIDQPARQTTTMHRDPFGVSSRVAQVGLGLLGRGASSTIVNRELARSEDVKTEIQSLVKHNLSAMHKDKKKLGSNGYKEVARVSTHTILAAYGLEHNEALAQSFSRPFCNHNKDMSNLVPSCCRGCFSAFVRQVVESVLLEKM